MIANNSSKATYLVICSYRGQFNEAAPEVKVLIFLLEVTHTAHKIAEYLVLCLN